MAIDPKYGRVTLEHGDIGEDEPVVVFRARDSLLPKLLAYYHLFCLKAGSPKRHLDLILSAREFVMDWQAANPALTRIPNSERSRAWGAEPNFRDAITGEFVTEDYAKDNPATTVRENNERG